VGTRFETDDVENVQSMELARRIGLATGVRRIRNALEGEVSTSFGLQMACTVLQKRADFSEHLILKMRRSKS